MKIIQLAESLAVGDAIANDVVELDRLFRRQGRSGGIYANNPDNISPRYLHSIAETTAEFPDVEPEDLVLLHHGIANDFVYAFARLRCRKVLIYHNITPPEYFEDRSEGLRRALVRGLEQTRFLADKVDYAIADSSFNRQNLLDMGYTCPVYVCPVLIPFEDYRREPDGETLRRYGDGRTNLLFVGRLAPHKKQEDILRIFYLYQRYYDPEARLFLVGGGDGAIKKQLEDTAAALGLRDVHITGSVSFPEILAYYRLADAFVCMSEHEGFCVPLAEAMLFDVPILARAAGAIPQTLGGSGILLEKRDFARAAAALDRLRREPEERERILAGQRRQLESFSYERVAGRLCALLEEAEKLPVISYEERTKALLRTPCTQDGREPFDLIIAIKAADWPTAQRAIPFIEKNIRPRRIVFLSSWELEDKLPDNPRYLFICENELLDGMTFRKIRQLLRTELGNPEDAGWYLQQFLKLGFARVTDSGYYLVWDADTLPVRPLKFFSPEGKPLFNRKREYVPAYFNTIRTIFGYEKGSPESYVTEHMLFRSDLVREMLDDIESRDSLRGESFWEKCLYAADRSERSRSFSEFETYGSYAEQKHPGLYEDRRLATLRPGVEFLGREPSEEVLLWAARDFDTISFESWGEPLEESLRLCGNKQVRKHRSFSRVIREVCRELRRRAEKAGETGDTESCARWRGLQPKLDFDFFFSDELLCYRRPELRLSFQAYDGLYLLGAGRRKGASILLEQGGMQYGPYARLPAGVYRAEVHGRRLGRAEIDCVCQPDCSPVTLSPLESGEELRSFRLLLPEERLKVELRTLNPGQETVQVDEVRFVPLETP